jgi:hypothetical protein
VATTEPNLTDRIDEAQLKITQQFLQQCTHGAQTRRLPNEFAACGQFIAGEAEEIEQFGLHGISAALRVLAPCHSTECGAIVGRLVTYCEAIFGVNPSHQIDTNCDLKSEDKQNVIKLGELLYGLSFVTAAQADRGPLIRHIADQLLSSMRNDKGWGYFLAGSVPELLPTAYAVRGLAQNGFDTRGPQRFLLDGLDMRKQFAHPSHADLTTAVACTYCLTFCGTVSDEEKTILRNAFLSEWRAFEPLLGEDFEQNLEYWHGKQTEYVRIPFQLYLLALAAEYSFWRFASYYAQRSLQAVVDALRTGSFKYSYSGECLSSRTNSIAFDVILVIRSRIRHRLWLNLANSWDRVRVFFGSKTFRVSAALVAFSFVGWAVWEWSKTGKVADLAPELLAGILMFFLTLGRRH